MNFQKRKRLILEKLEAETEVDIPKLSNELGVSEITVRRDLNNMAADGLLFRTHGGASKVNPMAIPHDFMNKAARNIGAKDKICRAAAAMIHDGDIIFMDCGSTVFRLCSFIRNKKIKVITNSLPVVYELLSSEVSLNIIGGEINRDRKAVHGSMANEHIERYHATKAFLGVDGISRKGLFANGELEADITRALSAHSSRTFLLCDESKIGRETYLNFGTLEMIDVLITDSRADDLLYFEETGIEVIRV